MYLEEIKSNLTKIYVNRLPVRTTHSKQTGHGFKLPPCLCLPGSDVNLFFRSWETSIPPSTVSYPSHSLSTPPHNSPTIYELRYDREIARMAE
jgi:hypothetical protein